MDISQSAQSAEFALRIRGATDPRCKIIMGQTNPDRPDGIGDSRRYRCRCNLPEDAAMCGRLGDCR